MACPYSTYSTYSAAWCLPHLPGVEASALPRHLPGIKATLPRRMCSLACFARFCMVLAWHDFAWFAHDIYMILHDMILHDMILHDMILHDMILHDMILHGFCMTWFCMARMVFFRMHPVLRKGDADEDEETNAVASCVGARRPLHKWREGATVKVEGATVKVAAAVQVAGGAATVQVAGHCTSGGGPLFKWQATVQVACAGHVLLTRRAGTGSPNEYGLAQRL